MKYVRAMGVFFMVTLFSLGAFAKNEVVRQLGGACGEDSNTIATCAAGHSCKDGYCAMNSFLSSATVGCRQAMQDKGSTEKYVAAHDGFCYIDSACRGLYEQAMAASRVTASLLMSAPNIDHKALSALSSDDQSLFQAAADTCEQCGKCVIGRQFLGRGGY